MARPWSLRSRRHGRRGSTSQVETGGLRRARLRRQSLVRRGRSGARLQPAAWWCPETSTPTCTPTRRSPAACPTASRRPPASWRSCSASGGDSIGRSTSPRSARRRWSPAREALLAGTTTLIDHHASPNAIDGSLRHHCRAPSRELGIRSILAYEVTDRDGPERARAGLRREPSASWRRVERRLVPLARGMVGAHASFTLSAETLAAASSWRASTRTGLHIHVAEDAMDQADAVGRSTARGPAPGDAADAVGPRATRPRGSRQPAEAALLARRAARPSPTTRART